MYFTRFHPIFPVLHAPTFRPSAKRSLLLLSICSIGSLFLGSAHAASQGLKIFETLNKAILSSVRCHFCYIPLSNCVSNDPQWEKYIMNGGSEAIAMVQAALLGQTFGLLSRVRHHLRPLNEKVKLLTTTILEEEGLANRTDLSWYSCCGKP